VPGNTSDKTTLPAMLALVQQRHGQANRIWVMDRGIPTVAALAQMRGSTPPVHYLDGTPKARLKRMEAALAERPWVEARGQLRVKRVPEDGEMYVLTESPARVDKERAMRRCALKKYWKRLGELTRLKQPKRDELLLKVGTAAGETGAAAHLVVSEVSPAGILTYHLVRDTRATARGAPPGGPLFIAHQSDRLRSGSTLAYYMHLVFVEEAFRTLKGDLAIRPFIIRNRNESKPTCCCPPRLLPHGHSAPATTRAGRGPHAARRLEETRHRPDAGRAHSDELLLVRRTEPEPDVTLILQQLGLFLPPPPPPRIRWIPPHSSAPSRLGVRRKRLSAG
jgi:hypothetical protein